MNLFTENGVITREGCNAFAVVLPEVMKIYEWAAKRGYTMADTTRLVFQIAPDAEKVYAGKLERGEIKPQ